MPCAFIWVWACVSSCWKSVLLTATPPTVATASLGTLPAASAAATGGDQACGDDAHERHGGDQDGGGASHT